MANLKQIKRRIKSVKSTQKITKTMEMIAAAKIKKAQAKIEAARPYAFKMIDFLGNVASNVAEAEHPLLESRPIEKVAIVSVTSNRGLCGAFNTNIIRRTEHILAEEAGNGRKAELILIGRKAISYFKFVGADIRESFAEFSDSPTFADAKAIADLIIELYINKEVDQVILVFNHFKSLMEQKPIEYRLLPIKEEGAVTEEGDEVKTAGEYLFEPSAENILYKLLPTYIETLVFRALLESVASEHAARRTAMKSASDNAEDMINSLTLSFNKARQAQITQEITEIVTSSEAIRLVNK